MPPTLSDVRRRLDLLQDQLADIVAEIAEIEQEGTFQVVDAPAQVPIADIQVQGREPSVPHRKRYYVVITPRASMGSSPGGQPGIYNNYTAYAEQVRNLSTVWTGRGPIAFAAGTFSKGFAYVKDADQYWSDQTGEPRLRKW